MHAVLLCTTKRGTAVLEEFIRLQPDCSLTVFSYRETPWEPPFLDNIRDVTLSSSGTFHETRRVDSREWESFWESTPVDIMFSICWRYMIPETVYRRPRLGTFVFHDSLLPEYRGFSPTLWAMINGEDHTGATLFEIAEDVDSGDIIDQDRIPIGPDETIGEVRERVTGVFVDLLRRNLQALLDGTAPRRQQDQAQASFTCKRLPEDNRIDWTASSETIHNLVRAVTTPYPGAFTFLADRKLYVWKAAKDDSGRRYVGSVPGRVLESKPGEGTLVATGDGSLILTTVQLGGDEPMGAADVLNSPSQTLGP